jgi:hypothetical protein
MSDRKTVNKKCNDVYAGYFDLFDNKTPDEIIKAMNDFKATYPNRDLYFSFETYGYDGGVELFVNERRLETDDEYLERVEKETLIKDKAKVKELKELAEYKRLKAKFESRTI